MIEIHIAITNDKLGANINFFRKNKEATDHETYAAKVVEQGISAAVDTCNLKAIQANGKQPRVQDEWVQQIIDQIEAAENGVKQ